MAKATNPTEPELNVDIIGLAKIILFKTDPIGTLRFLRIRDLLT